MAVFWAFAVVWPFHFVVVLYCLCGLARPLFSCSLLRCLPLLGGSDVFPRAWLKVFPRTLLFSTLSRNSAPWGPTCTGATERVFPAAIVYLLAPSFPKVNSDRRYLDVDSELRREASCLRGVSWVSNVTKSEMFEGMVGSIFLGWDQHRLRCLLFGRLFKALRVPIPVLRTTPSIAWGSTVSGWLG